MCKIWQSVSVSLIVSFSSVMFCFAQTKVEKHIYLAGSEKETKEFVKQIINKLPKIPGLGLKYGQEWILDKNNLGGIESIHIDKADWVVIVYTFPKYISNFMIKNDVNGKKHEMKFIHNGFFISTTDLNLLNCKVYHKRDESIEEKQYLPRGEYIWHIGNEGILLIKGDISSGTSDDWIIFYDKALVEFPASPLCILKMQPISTPNKGFQIGPKGNCFTPVDEKCTISSDLFNIKMKANK